MNPAALIALAFYALCLAVFVGVAALANRCPKCHAKRRSRVSGSCYTGEGPRHWSYWRCPRCDYRERRVSR